MTYSNAFPRLFLSYHRILNSELHASVFFYETYPRISFPYPRLSIPASVAFSPSFAPTLAFSIQKCTQSPSFSRSSHQSLGPALRAASRMNPVTCIETHPSLLGLIRATVLLSLALSSRIIFIRAPPSSHLLAHLFSSSLTTEEELIFPGSFAHGGPTNRCFNRLLQIDVAIGALRQTLQR